MPPDEPPLADVIALDDRRPPLCYSIHVSEFWNGEVKVVFDHLGADAADDECRDTFARIAAWLLTPADVHTLMTEVIERKVEEHIRLMQTTGDAKLTISDPSYKALLSACIRYELVVGVGEEPVEAPANDG